MTAVVIVAGARIGIALAAVLVAGSFAAGFIGRRIERGNR